MPVSLLKKPIMTEMVLPDNGETKVIEDTYYFSESLQKYMNIDEMEHEHLLRVIKKVIRGAVRNGQPHGQVRDAKFKVVKRCVKTTVTEDEYTVPSFIQ